MKSTFSAGRFSVEISEPHPVFVTLRMDERGLVVMSGDIQVHGSVK